MKHYGLLVLSLLLASVLAARLTANQFGATAAASHGSKPSNLYVLGPEDQIVLQGTNAEELVNKPMRIDASGDVTFPMIGRMHAGGLTVRDFETNITEHWKTFVRDPQIVVSVTEYKSHPVSVIGAVTNPGVVQLQGDKTLVEVIASAGGIRADADSRVTITREVSRGSIPLPTAKLDASGEFYSAVVNLKEITSGVAAESNIRILPHDVISVARAAMVYVIGEVHRAGGFNLGEDNTLTVVQALSLAEGPERTADLKKATIIRNSQSKEKRIELTCNIKAVLAGKAPDVDLRAHDILFVPGSTGKKAAMRTLEAAIQTGSGIAIWGIR